MEIEQKGRKFITQKAEMVQSVINDTTFLLPLKPSVRQYLGGFIYYSDKTIKSRNYNFVTLTVIGL
jgi:hypothetical protein